MERGSDALVIVFSVSLHCICACIVSELYVYCGVNHSGQRKAAGYSVH